MKVLIFILILTAGVASGCKALQASESDRPTGPAADPKGVVIAASRKLIALKSLSAIVEGQGQLAIRKDVQFVAPDRYHIKFDDETGAHVEMLSIGNDTYIRSGDSWNKLAGDDPSPTSTFRNSFTEDVLNSVSDVIYEGEDVVAGKPAFVYSYKLVTLVGNFPVSQRIWVDKVSGLPLKSVAEYANSQEKSLTTVFDSETPVSIDAPVN